MRTMRSISFIFTALILLLACKKENDRRPTINPCGIDFNTTVHYLAMGDGFSSGLYLDPTEAWPSIVVGRLEDQGYQVTDLSVFGAADQSSESLSAELSTTVPTCKNVVTIMVGAQDHLQGRSMDAFRNDYRSLINKAVALTGSAQRVTCVTLPDYSTAPGLPSSVGTPEQAQSNLMAMNAIIQEEAGTAGVNLADIFPISGALYSNANAYTPEDEFHADANQHLVWAEIIAFAIESGL